MKRYVILMFAMLTAACGKDTETVPPPGKVNLLTPAQNILCTDGTILSDTTSTLQFTWTKAENADGYRLYLQDLVSKQTVAITVTDSQTVCTLIRNRPYAWYVVSLSTKANASTKSDIWDFYVAAPAAVAYPPFPARVLTPADGAAVTSTKIDLSWSGSDADNDITGYDVYLSNIPFPTLLQANVTDMFLKDVPVTTGTYYWKIITHDSKGNTSDSGLFSFKVN
jgi:hypothetical protein